MALMAVKFFIAFKIQIILNLQSIDQITDRFGLIDAVLSGGANSKTALQEKHRKR